MRRKDYVYGYQIRCSIAFYQKSKHSDILDWLKNIFKCGYIRHRKTGISDYTIVEPDKVRKILNLVNPYVRLKHEHVRLGLKILDRLSQVNDADDFLKVCHLVDRFKGLNYSKKRTVTSENVRRSLERNNYLVPVETDSVKGESLDFGRG